MDKRQNSTNINWFPGHMAKTRKQITEDLKLVDLVIELLDARIPISSQNPEIAEIVRNKKRIVLLNKCDLADEKQNKLWLKYFQEKGMPAVLTDANSGRGINESIREIEKIMEPELKTLAEKGRIGRVIRAMIIGIPNVGKSSYINRISKKVSATVGNKPGVTKQKQWIRVGKTIELLDTPGVLWPKFESEEVGLHLAYTGTIKDDILERTEITFYLLKFLIQNYKEQIIQRYKLDPEKVEKILQNQDQDENINIYDLMIEIGRKRGAIVSGGNVDDEKISRIILDEFRSGKIGKITIEKR